MSSKPLNSSSTNQQTIIVGARDSNLSKAQFLEVQELIKVHYPSIELKPLFIKTTGDCDRSTSLKNLEKTNFFTKELDELLEKGSVHITINSAKDLPEPLSNKLSIIYGC